MSGEETSTLVAAEVGRLLPRGWGLVEELVGTDSFSDDLAGLTSMAAMIEPWWREIGFETTSATTESGHPVLVADRMVDAAAPTVLLLCHLDTVFPPGTVSRRPFRVADGLATGPGVADMKGGLAVAWLAVAAAIGVTGGLGSVNLRVLHNGDEEIGSVHSRPLIEAQAPEVDLAMVFEPGRPDGSMVTGRRGLRRYRISSTGRAAHTGVEPWAGVNAIEEIAHKVIAIQDLDDRERLLSVTVALIEGGSRINIVPESASMDVDVRIPDQETGAEVQRAVERIVAESTVTGVSSRWDVLSDRPPMTPQPGVEALAAALQEGAGHLGLSIPAVATGGGSDGCLVSALGIPTLDGLGPVGGGYHTDGEFVRVETLEQRAAVAGSFLARAESWSGDLV